MSQRKEHGSLRTGIDPVQKAGRTTGAARMAAALLIPLGEHPTTTVDVQDLSGDV
jgi:hypothetical protein